MIFFIILSCIMTLLPRSDPKAIPESHSLLGTGDLIVSESSSKGTKAKRARKRSNDGEKTSVWLPAGWTVIYKTRANGSTAGTVDKYYVEPITGQRFRSKVAVKRYLETGSQNKSKSDDNAQLFKKTGAEKEEAAWSFNSKYPPEEVTRSLVDEDKDLWTPSIGEEEVPEATVLEWENTYQRMCRVEPKLHNFI
ncbi:methyl-CpG-binding domain-containing protein 6-like [Apium graveolens]|uniref:methyl-CpG-binding domain-containing protein 6-like n=1 Tax=Apium graveolens TaxID=4045 RepID=UPI003D7B8776